MSINIKTVHIIHLSYLHLHVFKEPPDVRQELCSRLIQRMKSQALRDQLQAGLNRTTLQETPCHQLSRSSGAVVDAEAALCSTKNWRDEQQHPNQQKYWHRKWRVHFLWPIINNSFTITHQQTTSGDEVRSAHRTTATPCGGTVNYNTVTQWRPL